METDSLILLQYFPQIKTKSGSNLINLCAVEIIYIFFNKTRLLQIIDTFSIYLGQIIYLTKLLNWD